MGKEDGGRRCRTSRSGRWLRLTASPAARLSAGFASPAKLSNFICGELVAGVLVFLVENLPKETPRTGCPGAWMFDRMKEHFDPDVVAIQGTWVDPVKSDNLIAVNRLTAGGMLIEDAAFQTWTGQRAADHGFNAVELAAPAVGSPGRYTDVRVRFRKPGGQP